MNRGKTCACPICPILKSPKATQLIDEMQKALADEAKRRQEFYDWIDEDTKAEYINGQIILHSPVADEHWKTSDLLSSILSIYSRKKKLGRVGVEKVMIRLTHNDYEPDIVFFKNEKANTFVEGKMLYPAPDFIVEILSKSTARFDRTIKKEDYAAHGVQEYWIIDPIKQTIEQYLLLIETDSEYFKPYIYSIHDDISSRVIEGFTIPVKSIFDEAVNIETIEKLMSV